MEYRAVGRSDLKVSVLGFGGWLTLGDSLSEGDSHRMLDAARGVGITLFDLADSYAEGASERVVGSWLKRQKREELVISSKVFWPTGPKPTDRGLGRAHIMDAIDQSLRRLGTDYLDVYFCHREDLETPLGETAEAMSDLVRAGKIRHWGTSIWSPKRLIATHALCTLKRFPRPLVEQPPYNLLERWVEKRIVPLCGLAGMGMFTFSPLAQGLLTGKYAGGIPEGSRAVVEETLRAAIESEQGARAAKFARLAKDAGVEPAALALSWLTRQRGVSAVLMGASRPEQIEKNAQALSLPIDASLAAALDNL